LKKKNIILIHAAFWVLITAVRVLETVPTLGKYPVNIIAGDYFIYAASYVSFFYLYYFYITKEFLARRKTAFLIIMGLSALLIATIPVTYIYIYFISENVLTLSGKNFVFGFGRQYFQILETNFMYTVAGALLKTALLWYENVIKQRETEKQFIAGELALLRAQINPRFLFNTLNYIKSIIDSLPNKAIFSIENLSEIMSYMLYETAAEKVSLDSEISYIKNYISLQSVRYKPGFIDFKVTGDTSGKLIPPLLFMPLLENAFISGESFSGSAGINTIMDIRDNNLLFEINNNTNENIGSNLPDYSFDRKSIERWLDLQCGNNYSFEIKNEDNKHLIKLNIKLSG
jgi:two-component system, LytTR family, sensor kinase